MIEDIDGRMVSRRTREEEINLLRREFAQLTEPEQQALRALLRELGDPAYMDIETANDVGGPVRILDAIKDAEFLREPVPIRQFITDPYYLGETCTDFYPELLPDMEDLFAGGYSEVILTGSIGLDALVQDADGGLPTLGERIGVDSDVAVLLDDGQDFSTTEPGHHSGVKEVLRVTLANGMRLDLTSDHEIQVYRDGVQWVEVGDLGEDDLVLCARKIVTKPSVDVSIEAARLIAYWCTRARFCDGNPETSIEVLKILREMGFNGRRDPKGDNCWEVTVKDVKKSGFLEFLKMNEIDRGTYDVIVPSRICRASNEIVAEFMNRLWACEGTVYCPVSECSPPRIVLGMTSERFIRQVQMLLLRFGVQARIREIEYVDKRNGAERKIWHLQVSGIGQLERFLDAVGDVLGKEEACVRIRKYCASRKANTNVDCLPITWGWLNDRMVELGIKRKVGNRWWKLGTARSRRLSRDMFSSWLKCYGDTGLGVQLLKAFPESVFYERVYSIEPLREPIPVGDIGAHNGNRFIANGVSVHNSIGWGKTFFASIALCRMLYEISCLRNPHKSFGIAAKTNLAIVALSISEALAIKVIFENIATKISASPYFQEYYPYEETKKEMRFPNNVWVAARASTDNSALGLNVFGAIIDEGNFMAPAKKKKGGGGSRFGKKDQAELLYDKLKRRMKSRFQRHGRLPGMMIVVSSKNTKDDFTRKLVTAQKHDPDVFVRDYALWDVKSDRYSKVMFQVLVGNENVTSKVLEPEEVEEIRDNLQEGMHILDVPVDFKPDFTNDVDGSIRDIAGVETVSVSPFIQQRDRIALCTDNKNFPQRKHPFDVIEWDQSKRGGFQWSRLAHEVEIRDGASSFMGWQPKFYPGHTRHVHIDPSLNSDATGFAVGCVIGYTDVRRRDRDNFTEVYTESAPVIWIDFMLRIIPPVGGEINYGKIRSLVYQMQAHGFPIGLATMDQYNSADTMQKFTVKGIDTERLSLDRTMDPYDTTKAAIYEGRLQMYRYAPARKELQSLQKDNIKNKVDHPPKGSKDVADAIAGVVFSLTTNYRGGPLDIVKGISSYGNMGAEEQRAMVERDQTVDENEVMLPFIQG